MSPQWSPNSVSINPGGSFRGQSSINKEVAGYTANDGGNEQRKIGRQRWCVALSWPRVESSASSVHWLTQLKILSLLFQTQMHLRVQQEMSLSKAVCCVSSLTVARWADSLHPATSSLVCEAKNPDTPQFFIHIFLIHSFFHSLFHYGLSQDIKYSSLGYTVGPCLSILNVLFCIYQPQIPSPSLFLPPLLLGNHKSDLCVYESFSVL